MKIIYIHVDDATGENTVINITDLTAFCRVNMQVCKVSVTKEYVDHLLKYGGLEEHRLNRLTPLCMLDPIVIMQWTDGTCNVADGAHRYVKLYQNGIFEIFAWLVPEKIWRNYEMESDTKYTTEKLLKSFSGIL